MSFFAELRRRNVFKVGAAYVLTGWVLLQAGDNAEKIAPEALQEIQRGHLAHLKKLTDEGKIVVAGPFGDQPDPKLRGMCVYRTGLEETRKLAEADPAVKAGRLAVSAMTWYTPKGKLTPPVAE